MKTTNLAKSIRLALFPVVTACLSLAFVQLIVRAQGAVIYSQPHNLSGGLIQSSWCPPGEGNYDRYIWDNFTLGSTQVITEAQWRGGYDPVKGGSGGPVLDFTVDVYTSTAASSQPDIINPPLVQYQTGGNASETSAGTFGGVALYDYRFTLPAPFTATAGIKYWLYLVASQGGVNCIPDWGFAVGAGGDNIHFQRVHNTGDTYALAPGDVAFTLLGVPQAINGLTALNNSPTVLGRSTTFTATVSAGNGISYTWAFGDGVLGTGRILTHTYATTGYYTVIVTASNSLNTVTTTTPVTITLAPIAGLVASNDSPTFLGHATHLTATVAAGSNVAYQWNFGDGALGNDSLVTHTYNTAGFYTAIVTASNSINTLTATTRITITSVPIAGLTAINDSPTLLGNSTRLTATIVSGSNVAYQWNFGDGALGNESLVTHTYNTVGFYTAIVTASNSINTLTATTRITITDVPIAGLTAINDSPTLLGNSTRLTATIVSGSNVAYQWNFGDGALGNESLVTHTYNTAGFYTAIVTASNSASIVIATTPITIFGTMPLANAGPDQVVSTGTEVTLDGSGSFAPISHQPLTYLWQQTDGIPVVLNSYTISRPVFLAPTMTSVLTFTLVVTDSFNLVSQPDLVQIAIVRQYRVYLPLVTK